MAKLSEPQDRLGIFLVPARYTAELQAAAQRVAALEFRDDGSVGPPEWHHGLHELFERLLAVATAHRVLPIDTLGDFAGFTSSIDKRNRRAWDDASPSQRRALAEKHLAKISNSALRSAVADVLAHDAGADAGLWIESELALVEPPAPVVAEESEPHEDISPEDAERLLRAYIQNKERENPRRATRHAFVCELPEQAVDRKTVRLREAAITCTKETEPDFVDALEEFCERAGVESVAPCVYSTAQARELLKWLGTQRKSYTRELMASVLRPAVANKHAFAIVFEPALDG